MTDYKFTQDWFHWAPPVWEQLKPLLPGRKLFLEIGSFEGRSTVWIMEHMMEDGGSIECIDTWEGGEEHTNGEMGGAEARFDHNTKIAQEKFPDREAVKLKGTSVSMLADNLCLAGTINEYDNSGPYDRKETYDFIYIDGSHIAKDVLTDACMAWPLLKKGGIMVFDDYMWGEPRDILHRPKPAIDAFVNIFAEEVDMVHMGYQLIVRKK